MRNDPTKLMNLLNRLFQQQAREAMLRTRLDHPAPDMTDWVERTAEACKPILLALRQQGMIQASARIAAKLGRKTEVVMPRAERPSEASVARLDDGMRRVNLGNAAIFGRVVDNGNIVATKQLQRRHYATHHRGAPGNEATLLLKSKRRVVCKAVDDLKFSFDLFNPKVLDAVDAAAYRFCRETMETATGDLATSLDRLRQLMREGLPRGDAIALLAVKVREIFADPYRAFRIATTETSNAVHGGQMSAAVEAGVTHHTWVASADACELCLSLDGKTVRIGEPFYVDPRGGPYAVKLHPPAHPFCFCTTEDEI